MKYVLLLIAALTFAAPVCAEEYEKGPNGGLMLDVAGRMGIFQKTLPENPQRRAAVLSTPSEAVPA